MRITVYICVILFVCSTSCWAENTALDDIEAFLHVLFKPEGATLSDYYRFCGQGAEDEIQIFFEICKRKGWSPPEESKECLNAIKHREDNLEETPSLYLLWLKNTLAFSSYPEITIHEVKRYNGNFDHELIKASLNDINVTFFRILDPEMMAPFGIIDISKINDIPVSKIFAKDLEDEERDWEADHRQADEK